MPRANGYRELSSEQAFELEGVWVTAGLADAPNVPPTPLGWDLALDDVVLLGDALTRRGASLPRPSRRFASVAGFGYHALVPLLRAARELLPTDARTLAQAVACEAMPATSTLDLHKRSPWRSLSLLAARIVRGLSRLEARVLTHERDASQHYRWLVEMDLGILPDDALKTTLAECLAIYRATREIELEATLDLVGCHATLSALMHKLPDAERQRSASEALVPDALDLATATPALALFSASRRAREEGVMPSSAEFLSGFGERAAREREPYAPRWAEVPWLLDRALMLLRNLDSRGFEARQARARAERDRRLGRAYQAASAADALLLKAVVAAGRRTVSLRARLHVVRARTLFMLRTVVLDMDRRLSRLLGSAPEAAFFMRLQELLESTWRPDPLLSEVTRERHAAWRRACEQPAPPAALGRAARALEEPKSLCGLGLGDGSVSGKVKVAHDFEDALGLESGGVLVVRSLEPGWAPLWPVAGAIVCDVGGATSEGVLAAASLGIPLLVGTQHATRTLVDGATCSVDVTRGCLELT
ncbi:MAG: PEP-utilizing enzyme [Polyangiaceae bacterium]